MEQSNNEQLFSNEVKWVSCSQNQNKVTLSLKQYEKKESISFWSDAPLFQSSIDFMKESETINKFVIERIETVNSKKKILYGNSQIVIVEGIFAQNKFSVGQRVTILPCLCCIQEKGTNHRYDQRNINYVEKDHIELQSIDLSDKSNHKKLKSNILAFKEERNSLKVFHVNDHSNTILIEDDILTVTSFCKSMECINNPLINSTVADFSFEFGHPSLAIGIIIHELIQSSFIHKNNSFAFLTVQAKQIIKENLILLYSCNISDKEVLNEVLKNMRNIIKLINGNFNIQAVEHKVFSPFFGLKGSIDCLDSNFVIEIKTGKTISNEHRSQAILYSLLTMEQNLKKKFDNYGQFLCDVSIMKECLDAQSEDCKNSNHINVSNEVFCDNYQKLDPLLYYVKTGDFSKINLVHEEVVYLLKLRNDIACNKSISPCDCPELYPCAILNKIKSLNHKHYLKKLYDDIELESNREKKYLRCVKISQDKSKVVYKSKDYSLSLGDYVHIYSLSYKYLAVGIIENLDNESICIDLCDQIETDKIIMLCIDNDDNSLKFMRWSLIFIAYMKYLKKDSIGSGIDSFLLPGQKYGLDIEDTIEFDLSLDEIEFSELDSDLSEKSPDRFNKTKSNEIPIESENRNKINNIYHQVDSKSLESSEISFSTILSEEIETDLSEIETKRGFQEIFNSNSFSDVSFSDSDFLRDNGIEKASNKSLNSELSKISNSSTIKSEIYSAANDEVDLNSKNMQFLENNINNVEFNSPYLLHSSASHLELPKPRVLFNNTQVFDSFPYFTPSVKSSSFTGFKYCIPEIFKNEFLKLNENQRYALFTALNCDNYRVIHGMPGTGKSTLIGLLIRILVFYGQKVLLICYTHLAIQNILNKIGSVNYYRAKRQKIDYNSYDDVVKAFNKPDLVAGTCYSFNDPIYLNKKFDYCIIDEGSQIHLLLSLIPIKISQRFCIVGDHLQLKPLCKKAKILSESLFEYLIDKCTVLTHQYRMGDEIMNLSNKLFYDNRLVGFGGLSSVVFIDSKNINFIEYIKQLKETVVLCYFNSKVREIQNINKEITATTIDRFQGSEADEIIVIFDPVEQCSVLESNERLNVALTRARKKLILFGNKREMQKITIFQRLLDLIT